MKRLLIILIAALAGSIHADPWLEVCTNGIVRATNSVFAGYNVVDRTDHLLEVTSDTIYLDTTKYYVDGVLYGGGLPDPVSSNNLFAAYTFDTDLTTDEMGNTTASATGVTLGSDAVYGGTADIAGSDSYAAHRITISSLMPLGSEFTIFETVYVADENHASGTNPFAVDSAFRCYIRPNSQGQASVELGTSGWVTETYDYDQWNTIAWTRNSVNAVRLYYNGSYTGVTWTNIYNPSGSAYFGYYNNSAPNTSKFGSCYFFKRTLTDQEIADMDEREKAGEYGVEGF